VEPMFPGYVLAKFSMAEMERAVTFCQGVRGLVRFGNEIPPIPDSFVETMKREIKLRQNSEEEELVTLTPVIEIGDEVEVAHGPFQGMQGTVVAIPNATERVKILIEFLGNPQAVDMDIFSILLPRRPVP
jgi:transcriptional antiterminator RfaH